MSDDKLVRGDDSDVEAGRACPHCRSLLTEHNKAVYAAAWSMYQRHECGEDRHPKWRRVEPGTVIPAGQPYRVEYPDDANVAETASEFVSVGETADDASWRWFVDSSWRPPLELPTEPGSVIEASNGGSVFLWMRGGRNRWVKETGQVEQDSALNVVRILFDAGKDPREYAPGLIDNSGEFA